MSNIPFNDLAAQQRRIRSSVDAAIGRVLDRGAYIMGPEVTQLEGVLSEYCGAHHVITCANGTDALRLVLMAEGIGPGDSVIVPSFSFVATGEVLPLAGASPVFVDVDDTTYNMSVESLEGALHAAQSQGLNVKAIITVDLFGRASDYDSISRIAKQNGLILIADAAQSFGGEYKGTKVGCLADYTTTSFYPAKPLGCYGDGGAIFTDNSQKADLLQSIRIHGQGENKYDNVRVGLNSRLDTIQAAILLEKMNIFDDELEVRNRIAVRYNELLNDVCVVPLISNDVRSSWAQYTVRVGNREAVRNHLQQENIPTAVFYPRPIHVQPPYRDSVCSPGGLDVTERLATEVLSLPMHPYLDGELQNQVAQGVRRAIESNR